MKQVRSSSYSNSRLLIKKQLLPFFQQSKLSIKIQEISSNNHSQLFFNIKFIPFEIVCQRKLGDLQKILVNASNVIIIEGNKNYKGVFKFYGQTFKEWIQLNFGEVFVNIRIRKVGDQYTFANCSHVICWDRLDEKNKRILATINIKQIIKGRQKNIQPLNILYLKDEIEKQLKLQLPNPIIKRHGRKMTQKFRLEEKYIIDRSTCTLKNKNTVNKQQSINQIKRKKYNQSSTVCSSSISGVNQIVGIKPFCKEIVEICRKRNSQLTGLTGKSEKQTSICDHVVDQNSFLTNNYMPKTDNLTDCLKKRSKFDSQPYFYQNCNQQSQFPSKINSMNKFTNRSRQDRPKQIQRNPLPRNNIDEMMDCLKNQTLYQSQQQVEEDIKRVDDLEESIPTFDDKNDGKEINNKDYESNQESSGTLYESKYQ